MYIIKRLCTKVFSYTLTVYSNLDSGLNQSMVEYKGNKKLSCRREAVRCFVFVCSQLQHTYSAVKNITARRVCIACICSGKMSVCLSVCHTSVLCLTGYTYPQSFFTVKRDTNIPTGIRLTGAPNARGYEKITIFDQYWALSWNWCDKKSGVNTTKNVNDYYNVRSEICLFVLELFNCLCSEVRKCK